MSIKQLSPTDGQLLHSETINAAQHIASVTLYDQSKVAGGPVKFKDILKIFESRLHQASLLTDKLKRVPLSLDQPYRVPDESFDLEYHVRHLALPAPGDWRQLCIQLARLHSQGLDLNRPLWQAYIIEGIDNTDFAPKGSFAMYLKVHHSIVDGISFEKLYRMLHELTPDGQDTLISDNDRQTSSPSTIDMLSRLPRNLINLQVKSSKLALGVVPRFLRQRKFNKLTEDAAINRKPTTRFDSAISQNRVFNAESFPIKDFKAIRSLSEGCTLNDVSISIISGAVRKYLEHHSELPEESLIAWLPVSLRDPNSQHGGNVFTTLTSQVFSNEADPLVRLNKITEHTQTLKKQRLEVGEDLFVEFASQLPAFVQSPFASVATWSAKMGASAIPANFTISNVPGSPVPVYFAGAKAVMVQPLGLIQDGHGLFHVVSSYCADFMVSFVACREQMPDPQFYAECLRDSFKEYMALTKKAKRNAKPKKG